LHPFDKIAKCDGQIDGHTDGKTPLPSTIAKTRLVLRTVAR